MPTLHVPTATALDEDGAPVWTFVEGAPLVPGVRAWERLGVGGRCEVWLGWDQRMWAPVVVKLPRPHQVEHPRARASLAREVRALDGVLHPHLPRLYRHDLDATTPYLVEEHVDGPDLEDLLDRRRTSATAVALLGVQVLSALLPLHARGVAHLDVKPGNVVLRDGRAVLVDLGSSRPLASRQPAGRPVGTPGWTSPEMEACEPVSTAMDVYGVGAVLRHAWSRRVPSWRRSAVPQAVQRLLEPLPERRPTVAEALELLGESLPATSAAWPRWVGRTISA
jgi:eukaryotic-like serine/threonine-protein kinase